VSHQLPSGDVTLLMTDIEASTEKWERYPGAMRHAVALHDRLLRDEIEREWGSIVKALGDSFLAAFENADRAARAAVGIQEAVHAAEWPCPDPIRVRIGINSAELVPEGDDYFGQPVNRLARIVAAGHGSQILLSDSSARQLGNSEWGLRDLGRHRLAGVTEAQRIFQLDVPSLPERFGPLRTPEVQPNNLPVEVTEFLGRESEIEMLTKLLRKPETDLVTLTGPGGVGKSRLAARVAEELMPHFQHGVWWIALSPLPAEASADQVARRAMQAMRMNRGEGDAVEALADGLAGHQMLLIWDNFEHQTGSAELLATLMRRAPEATHLVTSREILRLSGEYEWVVGELNVFDAVRLFEETAQRADPSFTISPDTREAVEQICRRLDCLPLAVELAAGQMRMFTPKQIFARLDDRFALLASSKRDVEERQKSLHAAIEWSYDTLTSSEKLTFQNLCVLRGNFSLAAAEAICGTPEVLADVAALREKSLLRTIEIGGEMRFDMLESIGEYGLEKLSLEGDVLAVKRRHVKYYSALMEDMTSGGWHLFPVRSVRRLVRARDQIRAAARYAFEIGDDRLISRFMSALLMLPFYLTPFSMAEMLRLLRDTLPMIKEHSTPMTACRAQFLLGGVQLLTNNDSGDARQLLEEALNDLRQMDDPRSLAVLLGIAAAFWSERREELIAELKTIVRRGDAYATLYSAHFASQALALEGRIDEAITELSSAVAELKDSTEPQLLLSAKMYLAELALLAKPPDEVKEILDSMPIKEMDEIDYTTAAMALAAHAEVETLLGNYDRAETWYAKWIAMHEEAEDVVLASQANAAAAELAIVRGNLESAAEFCGKSYAWLATTETHYVRLPYLIANAFLALARNEPADALASISLVPRGEAVFVLGPWRETAVAIVACAEWLRRNADSAARLFAFACRKGSPLYMNRKSVRLMSPYYDDFLDRADRGVRELAESVVAGWSIEDALSIAEDIAADHLERGPIFA